MFKTIWMKCNWEDFVAAVLDVSPNKTLKLSQIFACSENAECEV